MSNMPFIYSLGNFLMFNPNSFFYAIVMVGPLLPPYELSFTLSFLEIFLSFEAFGTLYS